LKLLLIYTAVARSIPARKSSPGAASREEERSMKMRPSIAASTPFAISTSLRGGVRIGEGTR
jgi:hypothetical protein